MPSAWVSLSGSNLLIELLLERYLCQSVSMLELHIHHTLGLKWMRLWFEDVLLLCVLYAPGEGQSGRWQQAG